MTHEYLSGGEIPQAIVPEGPPTHAEIWQQTINLLQQSPAAYLETAPFSEAPAGTIHGYDNKWGFHNYDPDADGWDHISVHGAVPEYGFSEDLQKALTHLHNRNSQIGLTKQQMKEGVLGVKATQFCGVFVSFPTSELLRATAIAIPQQVRRLTIQARHGVKGQDPTMLRKLPSTLIIDRLQHPSEETGFVYGNIEDEHFRALLEVNGVIERLLPHFAKSTALAKDMTSRGPRQKRRR